MALANALSFVQSVTALECLDKEHMTDIVVQKPI